MLSDSISARSRSTHYNAVNLIMDLLIQSEIFHQLMKGDFSRKALPSVVCSLCNLAITYDSTVVVG